MNTVVSKNELKQLRQLGLIGQSESFLQVIESISQVAPTNITVLITGESGTGKEMVAKAIHQLSLRHDKAMLTVNCGAIPEGILESELFGHEKGAFTGAHEQRKGYFELADGGTLFLDEIGEMPLGTQVKLLRVLQEKEFIRVGGSKLLKADVRVLAATNKDLEQSIQKGTFRKDLFYRLNSVKINLPPLRKRIRDIRLLANQFADEVGSTNNIRFDGFTEDAYDLMESYTWPGNIRELKNIIERVIVLEKGRRINEKLLSLHLNINPESDFNLPVVMNKTPDQAERELIYRALIDLRMVVEEIRGAVLRQPGRTLSPLPMSVPFSPDQDSKDYDGSDDSDAPSAPATLKEIERQHIERALIRCRGNRRKAARELGIGERTLYRKIKEYHLE